VDTSGKDAYQRFELNLPFARHHCVEFWGVIVAAQKECGNEGYVTVDALREQLPGDVWKDLDNKNSDLVRIL